MYCRCRITGNSEVSWNRTPQSPVFGNNDAVFPKTLASSPTRILSRSLASAGLRLLDSARSTTRSVPASVPATLASNGSSPRATLIISPRRRLLHTVTTTPGRHTTLLEVERPPPWIVTKRSWTASIASDMDLDKEFHTPEL